MSFAAPLFLLGLLAVGLPIWLHRLKTQSAERRPFSSAMLLETATEQVHVRRQLKYLALLAARILLLTFVAFAFAKPFIAVPPEVIVATDAGTHVIVIDRSASMGREGVFDQALVEARSTVESLPAEALLQVVAADQAVEVVGTLGNDRADAVAALDALSPGSLRLDYGEVMSAVESIVRGMPPPVTLHVVSDFQASGMPARFSDVVPAGVSELVTHVVGTGQPFNWSVQYLRETDDALTVGLTGAGDRERLADVELSVNGNVVEARGLSQTGPQSMSFDAPEFDEGQNRVVLSIVGDDDLALDNTWYRVVDRRPPRQIPVLTADPGGLPFVYLSAALESSGVYRVQPLAAGQFDPRVLSRYGWIVIDDIGIVDPTLEAALADFVVAGGNLLAFAGQRAGLRDSMPVTGHRQLATGLRQQDGSFLSVGQVDRSHPALDRTEGWQSVHVTRNLSLDPGDDQVPVRLSNGDPFLLERRIGEGRALLVSSAIDNQWSDLPVRPVFVSLVIEIARYLSGSSDLQLAYTVGDTLPLSDGASGQVIDPDGNSLFALADTRQVRQIRLSQPGFYEVYTREGQAVIAANVDTRESDLRKIDQDTLERWKYATDGQAFAAGGDFLGEQDRTVELWHWFLLILAVVVVGESILGNMHLSPRRTERA